MLLTIIETKILHSEDSKSRLPAVGAEEIHVRVSSVTDNGDLFVVKVRQEGRELNKQRDSLKKSKQFICSRETKILVLTKLPKVPDVAEQSRPPTQVEAPAPWSNMIVTMFREKNDFCN